MPVTNYLWDPVDDNVIMETDENDVTTATYTHLPGEHGELISQHRDGATSYYQYDGLGNTQSLTDETGTVTDTYTYDAWGNTVASTGTTENPFRWNGRSGYYYDQETADYYVRARVYEPTIARWTTVDPLGFVDGLNLFQYAGNNPVLFVDPTGHLSVYEASVIASKRVPKCLLLSGWRALGCRTGFLRSLSDKQRFEI